MRSKLGFLLLCMLAVLNGRCSCEDAPSSLGGDATKDASVDATSVDLGSTGDAAASDTPFTDGSDGTVGDIGTPDGAVTDAGTDAGTIECNAPTNCMVLFGAPPCGAWECNGGLCELSCPGCTDLDRDGYGVGGGCAGPDCDDADDLVFADVVRACYTGPPPTANRGVCRPGTETCVQGVLSPCVGEVTPSAEACNLEDDDCDLLTDEDLGSFQCGLGACTATVAACTAGAVGVCTPGMGAADDSICNGIDDDCDGPIDEECPNLPCVTVAVAGDDTLATSNQNATPFATIQAAIDWSALDASRPRTVCVAPGLACGASATFQGGVTMSNGISLLGGYEAATWTRCANSTTEIQPGTPEGILFPAAIVASTTLDGFRILRALSQTVAAVTLDGAANVTLSNLVIDSTPVVTNSYGINLVNGAQAIISECSIFAGNGTAQSIGIRSIGSLPTIISNCQNAAATGRCTDFCGNTNRAIRGRFTTGTGETFGVLLESSPGARIEANAICGIDADTGAGVHIRGDATGTVIRANLINAWGGAIDSHGIWAEDCGGASPWVVDNSLIAAVGDTPTTRVDGVRAIGDCHVVVDSNELITGGGEGGTSSANGVYCGANRQGIASRCTVIGNLAIQGSSFGLPPVAVGVRCDDRGCLRIAQNNITGHGGITAWGVWLGTSGTLVERNQISGGCGSLSSVGIRSENSFARIENNWITGGTCNAVGGVGGTAFVGLQVLTASGAFEVDVHSNTIDGRGRPNNCASTAVELGISGTGRGRPLGLFRNNILRAGLCGRSLGFAELDPGADPRLFANNDLDPFNTPVALYFDEGAMALTTTAAVNGLIDTMASGNLSVDPSFVAYPNDLHLMPNSMCIDAGTSRGAPAIDLDGDPRDPTPDIGADEL